MELVSPHAYRPLNRKPAPRYSEEKRLVSSADSLSGSRRNPIQSKLPSGYTRVQDSSRPIKTDEIRVVQRLIETSETNLEKLLRGHNQNRPHDQNRIPHATISGRNPEPPAPETAKPFRNYERLAIDNAKSSRLSRFAYVPSHSVEAAPSRPSHQQRTIPKQREAIPVSMPPNAYLAQPSHGAGYAPPPRPPKPAFGVPEEIPTSQENQDNLSYLRKISRDLRELSKRREERNIVRPHEESSDHCFVCRQLEENGQKHDNYRPVELMIPRVAKGWQSNPVPFEALPSEEQIARAYDHLDQANQQQSGLSEDGTMELNVNKKQGLRVRVESSENGPVVDEISIFAGQPQPIIRKGDILTNMEVNVEHLEDSQKLQFIQNFLTSIRSVSFNVRESDSARLNPFLEKNWRQIERLRITRQTSSAQGESLLVRERKETEDSNHANSEDESDESVINQDRKGDLEQAPGSEVFNKADLSPGREDSSSDGDDESDSSCPTPKNPGSNQPAETESKDHESETSSRAEETESGIILFGRADKFVPVGSTGSTANGGEGSVQDASKQPDIVTESTPETESSSSSEESQKPRTESNNSRETISVSSKSEQKEEDDSSESDRDSGRRKAINTIEEVEEEEDATRIETDTEMKTRATDDSEDDDSDESPPARRGGLETNGSESASERVQASEMTETSQSGIVRLAKPRKLTDVSVEVTEDSERVINDTDDLPEPDTAAENRNYGAKTPENSSSEPNPDSSSDSE